VIADIRRLIETRPFRPFVIHIADGRELKVPHPDYASFMQITGRVIVQQDNGEYDILSPLLISGVQRSGSG